MPSFSDTLVIGWRDLRHALDVTGVPDRVGADALVFLVFSQFCDAVQDGVHALSAGAFARATLVVVVELALSRRAYNGALGRLERAGLLTFIGDPVAPLDADEPHVVVVRLDALGSVTAESSVTVPDSSAPRGYRRIV